MDSSGWAVTDSSMSTSTDDGFQQFLDMNTMDNLGQTLDYHFHGFQQPAGSHILQPHSANQLDVSMTGTDAPILLSPAVSSMQQQMPSMTTSAPFQALPAAMMPPPTPSEALMNSLDAQIQFLQQQKMQHQQRQLEEQQTAFFARNTGSIVPPTPQSLELQPGAGQFYGTPSHNAEQRRKQQRQQQHQQHHSADYGYQRISEQSDVRGFACYPPLRRLVADFSADVVHATCVSGRYAAGYTVLDRVSIRCLGRLLQSTDLAGAALPE
jgi:hypothetical protein